jgi:4-amino-4-deoxy-L-arabinose transferase-like glycosyltransferase
MDRRHDPLIVATLALTALIPGLGATSRLSYHEALVAQGAREMLATSDWLVPTIAGQPWLEKPPLAHWLVALAAAIIGRVDETAARLPSALAAVSICLCVTRVATINLARPIGLLAGGLTATSAWLVARGRLADADMLLAALVTACLTCFNELRQGARAPGTRWLFFSFLGATALAKGIGFGAALAFLTIAGALIVNRDLPTIRRLAWLPGWALATLIALAWPLAVLARHPQALELWLAHGPGRLIAARQSAIAFAADPWPSYVLEYLALTLPGTPLALLALARHLRTSSPGATRDPFLLCWAALPALFVSVSPARNAHYLLASLPPWSIAAALTLDRAARALIRRGMRPERITRIMICTFAVIASAWSLGYALVGPALDARGKGREWAFYEACASQAPPSALIYLLYDAPDRPDRWDREPYATPFGPVPPDLAARLFYLDGPAIACHGIDDLARRLASAPRTSIALITRPRDLPALEALGAVSPLAHGPATRPDRAFAFVELHAMSRGAMSQSSSRSSRLEGTASRRCNGLSTR